MAQKVLSRHGPSDAKEQDNLAKKMQINYRAGVGELIWAMTTCQRNDLKHTIKYLYSTHNDGIYYYWSTQPRDDLPEPEGPPPTTTINSNKSDLLLSNRPQHDDATTAVA